MKKKFIYVNTQDQCFHTIKLFPAMQVTCRKWMGRESKRHGGGKWEISLL